MSRYIDAELLKQVLKPIEWGTPDERWVPEHEIGAMLDYFPAADVVEVVRCRECKYRDTENGLCEGRGWPMQLVPDDGFCDKGERRASDE